MVLYTTDITSPMGTITLASDGEFLTGLWLPGQKLFDGLASDEKKVEDNLNIFLKAKDWLNRYFDGRKPDICELPLRPKGSEFRLRVWEILREIPYGEVVTYGDIAKQIAREKGRTSMSAQAVGGAVGHNPISIIIPCHRVVGSNGNLTGYAGGIEKKVWLLEHEGCDMSKFMMPGVKSKPADAISPWKPDDTEWTDGKKRCRWTNPKNPAYIRYHDEEWGVPSHDDRHLFEMLILESFQAGLSWECILNKREAFREAFDRFDIDKVCAYTAEDEMKLMGNPSIVRNRRKIAAAVNNARIFRMIQQEYGSFSDYIWGWTDGKVICERGKSSSELSDRISKDLKKRGMKFVGTTIIYAYLQAVGVIWAHEEGCFLEKQEVN